MKHKKFNLKSTVLFNYANAQKVQKTDDPTTTLSTLTITKIILNR